jgi:hypothetical protein
MIKIQAAGTLRTCRADRSRSDVVKTANKLVHPPL